MRQHKIYTCICNQLDIMLWIEKTDDFILYTTSNNNLIHYCSVILEEKRREESKIQEKGYHDKFTIKE